ncbi:hypothetical protein PAEPH01_0142 [Pancytospora epiphaga]|nr:hypothetical protein PAEPH01_0142 [Pancytospora epiphaga]
MSISAYVSSAQRTEPLSINSLFLQDSTEEREEDPRVLLATKIKRCFPNLSAPRFYSNGKKHTLEFMEYAFITDMSFDSTESAEHWLSSQAMPIVNKICENALRLIEKERVEQMCIFSKSKVKTAENVKSNTKAEKLSLKSIPLGRKLEVSSVGNNISNKSISENQHGGIEHQADIPVLLPKEPENHEESCFPCDSKASSEESTYAQAFSDITECKVDGLLNSFKLSKPEIFPVNESPLDKHFVHLEDLLSLGDTLKASKKEKQKSMLLSERSVNLTSHKWKKSRLNNTVIKENLKSKHGNNSSIISQSESSFISYSQIFGPDELGPPEELRIGDAPSLVKRPQQVLATTSLPDFEIIKKKYASGNAQSIDIVRELCFEYDLFHPEYELVRENDVYCCTATFCGMNFVSPYSYDKYEAKNGACDKVYEYIVNGWSKVYFYNITLKKKRKIVV